MPLTKRNLLEPVTKAKQNNEKNIKKLVERINELQSIVNSFLVAQSEFNLQIAKHQHDDIVLQTAGVMAGGGPFAVAGGKVPPSVPLIVSGIKCTSNTGIAQADVMMNELKTTLNGLMLLNHLGLIIALVNRIYNLIKRKLWQNK